MAEHSASDSSQISTRLLRLCLNNYRQFAEVEMTFHPRLTVLVAPNGGGKTAILDAIAVAFRYFVDSMRETTGSEGFVRSDIRIQKNPDGSQLRMLPTLLDASATIDGRDTIWKRELKKENGRTTDSGAKALKTRADVLLDSLKQFAVGRSEARPSLPVLTYYGTGRLWSQERSTKGRPERATDFSYSTAAYEGCLEPKSSYSTFRQWFEAVAREAQNEQASGIESPHRPAVLLKALRTATDSILKPSGWSRLDWDFIDQTIKADHPEFGRLDVSFLSDGTRNLIALVADLAHRCVRLNPHLGEDAPCKTPGVVLIDEVGMHLHPGWQQLVLGSLQSAFSCIQFIVSTHSPLVLSSVDASSIRVIKLLEGGRGEFVTPTFQAKGSIADDVLSSIMEVNPSPETEETKMLRRYQKLIGDGEGESMEGNDLRGKLEEHFGVDHPEMRKCQNALRFQAFKRDRSSEGQD